MTTTIQHLEDNYYKISKKQFFGIFDKNISNDKKINPEFESFSESRTLFYACPITGTKKYYTISATETNTAKARRRYFLKSSDICYKSISKKEVENLFNKGYNLYYLKGSKETLLSA